jgi:hypothetical protein
VFAQTTQYVFEMCINKIEFFLFCCYLTHICFFVLLADVFLPLDQPLGWSAAGINLLDQLVVAQHDRSYTEYSLTRDAIADVSPKGDFIPFLGRAYNEVLGAVPTPPRNEDLSVILNKIAPTNQLSFHQVLKNSKELDRRELEDLVCQILGQL